MNFLADENIETAMVRWLRDRGHDVVWAREDFASSKDAAVLETCNRSSRILLTRDLDFGELVFREPRVTRGIILLRVPARNQWERLEVRQSWWPEIEQNAPGHFVTVTNKGIRVRVLPPADHDS